MKPAAVLLAGLLGVAPAAAQGFLDCRLVAGWEPTGPARHYDAGNLFEYKDGGAQGYLVFGFVRMSTIECKSGGSTLTIDVSEMTDPDAAYGIFAANRDPTRPTTQIGMGGQVQAQSAIFAKGNFYAEIVETAGDSSRDDSETMRAFASAMEVRMQGRIAPPAQVGWFPPGNVAPIRMVPESVLGLRDLKRGYVTNYAKGQAFLVLEDTPGSAELVMKALRMHFAGAGDAPVGDEAFETSTQYLDGICIFRKGRVIGGFTNLPTPQQAAEQAARLAARIP